MVVSQVGVAALTMLLVQLVVVPATAQELQNIFRYNICNGLSNQLLLHASGIAKAIRSRASIVEVPDYFIVNGEQSSDDNVMPAVANSVPLGVAFDTAHMHQRLEELGIQMELVRWEEEESVIANQRQIASETQIDLSSTRIGGVACERLSSMAGADPQLTLQILQAFKPSSTIRTLTKTIMTPLKEEGLDQGICFHHRNGQDWHDHCSRWENATLEDGLYRGNCEAESNNGSLLELLEDRALTSTDRWIYYCGDHEVPAELRNQTKYTVHSKEQFMSEDDQRAVQAIKPGANVRDVWALMDYSICGSLHYLVGNSVSTFSALQIAARQQEGTYWYNSQSIPLGDVWNIFQIPIVYTYTELSDAKGKHMLKASIASLRQHMPRNQVSILYHGTKDKEFQQWLRDQRVKIFKHDPEWKDEIEHMRKNGNADTSHLFFHEGNYFGTWQRIDIPQFIETEYCLLLDADTVVMQPFTLSDFGLNLTHSIGMSAERHRHHEGNLLNAGVTLVNVPHMRATHSDFMQFIFHHVDNPTYNHPAPSDQGAYLDFYETSVQRISNFWNWKAYWGVKDKNNMFRKIKVLHFHGMKPHDYVKKLLGFSCDEATRDLCSKFKQPFFQVAVNRFLAAASSIPNFHRDYCNSSFDTPKTQSGCLSILDGLIRRDFNKRTTNKGQQSQQSQQQIDQQEDQPEAPSAQKRWMRASGLEGFWDGDHTGLDKRIITVSRPASRKLEDDSNKYPKKMQELSYEYLDLSDEIAQDLSQSNNEEQSATLARLQYRLLLLTGTLSLLFTYLYSRKNRRVVFVFVCVSAVVRHILALGMLDFL